MATNSSILAWRISWNCIAHRVAKSRTSLFYLFIYFWPCCVFVAFCKFSLVAANGTTPCCGAWASRPLRTSPVAQMLMSLPVMQDTPVLSLSQEDPLEKEMATDSSILAWRIHGWRSLAMDGGV